jgi:cell division protein FtsL
MTRLNLLLMSILVVCALGVVTSQHHARKLYAELQHAQEFAKQMQTEYGQLQLEQSTWAMHARIEKIAIERLRMRMPEPSQIQMAPVTPAIPAAPIARTTGHPS